MPWLTPASAARRFMVNWENPLRAKQRMVARMISFERVWFGSGLRGIAVSVEPFPFRWNRNGALSFCFDAFSSREPVSTSLENALPLAAAAMVGDGRSIAVDGQGAEAANRYAKLHVAWAVG